MIAIWIVVAWVAMGAAAYYLLTAYGHAKRWVPLWRRMARDNRAAAADEPAHIIECRLLAEQMRDTDAMSLYRPTLTLAEDMTQMADGAVKRQQGALARAERLEREVARMRTWPFTVREEADR